MLSTAHAGSLTLAPVGSSRAALSSCCRRVQVCFRRTNRVRLQRTPPETGASSRASGGATCTARSMRSIFEVMLQESGADQVRPTLFQSWECQPQLVPGAFQAVVFWLHYDAVSLTLQR